MKKPTLPVLRLPSGGAVNIAPHLVDDLVKSRIVHPCKGHFHLGANHRSNALALEQVDTLLQALVMPDDEEEAGVPDAVTEFKSEMSKVIDRYVADVGAAQKSLGAELPKVITAATRSGVDPLIIMVYATGAVEEGHKIVAKNGMAIAEGMQKAI